MDFNLIATATFGLEALVAKELKVLGYEDLETENGRVKFSGDEMDVAIANTYLRCADRVQINMGEFDAATFEELFQGVLALPWEELMPPDAFMHVNGKSVKSLLHSVPDCQSITKKAIVSAMSRKYPGVVFKEDGPTYKIEVALLKDHVTMTIDTTGAGLHKRGYRKDSGAAPLKETLAAAIVMLSGWKGEVPLYDPFCGSGTILIEAAMIARNMAPGIYRKFACEAWPNFIEEDPFSMVRQGARSAVDHDKKLSIYGYDKDTWVLSTAKANAKKANVYRDLQFAERDAREFEEDYASAAIITNPPYGERLDEEIIAQDLSKVLGNIYRKYPKLDVNVFTALKDFERYFGRRSDKNRKLYNGRLLCYLYQYYKTPDPKPAKVKSAESPQREDPSVK